MKTENNNTMAIVFDDGKIEIVKIQIPVKIELIGICHIETTSNLPLITQVCKDVSQWKVRALATDLIPLCQKHGFEIKSIEIHEK